VIDLLLWRHVLPVGPRIVAEMQDRDP
jgi:hypothetical protein